MLGYTTEEFKALPAQTAKCVLIGIDKVWKSYRKSISEYSKNPSKFSGKPKIPKYKDKDGCHVAIYPNQNLNVKNGNGWSLINLDASSFYPHLMVQWDCLSRAIPDKSLYANLVEERLKLKSVITPFEDKYGKHPENAPIEEYEVYKDAAEKSAAYKLILNI